MFFSRNLFSDQWVSIRGERAQILKLCVFRAIIVQSTQFVQNWVLFNRKRYTDGWLIGRKSGKEKVKVLKLAGTSAYNFGESKLTTPHTDFGLETFF